jgi:DNA-binding CsgD family transcriptional regulator
MRVRALILLRRSAIMLGCMPDRDLSRSGILDRVRECDVLERLVADVRTGRSHVLVLRGEAGIGKTVLLDHLSAAAQGSRIVRVAGVESEMELGFAGLHALCAPMLSRMSRLPIPQRDALGTAFGLSEGAAPDRFLVGLAVLSMLADAAEEKALFCIVDDAQWLDQVSLGTLVFVARRLLAERVGIVFALRGADGDNRLEGLPELVIEGLPAADARALLEATIPGPLDKRVKNRILGEAAGNPLALLELPRGDTGIAAAGGFGLPREMPLTGRLERGFVRQVEALPAATQSLLLLAAAEPLGDVTLLWRAAQLLDIGPEAAAPAEAAGLIEIGARVQFRHPLVRTAAYVGAATPERREAHRALGEATDPELDPDRRAWHRARAADGPDEAVAGELERSADRAQARGGMAAAAAFLARAAELTPDPASRVDRSLAAAEAKLDAADASAASDLLATAELGPFDAVQRGKLERLGAQIVFAQQRGRDAPPLLLAAAKRLESLDPAMARETFLEGIASAMFAGRLGTGTDAREIAEAARSTLPAEPTNPADQLLDALVRRFTEGYAASVKPISLALRRLAEADDRHADRRWLWLACRLAQDLWDDDLWHVLATRGVHEARQIGALELLPNALNYLAAFNAHSGRFAIAAAQVEEVEAITRTTGLPPLKYGSGMLAAGRGDEAYYREIVADGVMQGAQERGEGSAVSGFAWGKALLHNGQARYAEAFDSARFACEYEDPNAYGRALAELVEAGVRCGKSEEASAAFERLSERTRASGTEWALGIEARCRGLVTGAEPAFEESTERLARSRGAFELARSQLVFGEWLRRENRRGDARERLRVAHELFTEMGAGAFAERAGRELSATGETVRKRTVETRDDLTAQEAQVARLARDGHTNPEIGAQLFISPRTVEYHLHKVFAKLGIGSRKELRKALPAEAHASSPV